LSLYIEKCSILFTFVYYLVIYCFATNLVRPTFGCFRVVVSVPWNIWISQSTLSNLIVINQTLRTRAKTDVIKLLLECVVATVNDMKSAYFNSLASGCFRGFSEKKRLNACGFAREFLWSCVLYRRGKSLKRRSKSSSLHSKKYFCLRDAFFL